MEEKQVTNQPTATRASSQLRSFGNCSYLGDGEPISEIGTQALSPGKDTFPRRLPVGQYRDRHFNVDLVIGSQLLSVLCIWIRGDCSVVMKTVVA